MHCLVPWLPCHSNPPQAPHTLSHYSHGFLYILFDAGRMGEDDREWEWGIEHMVRTQTTIHDVVWATGDFSFSFLSFNMFSFIQYITNIAPLHSLYLPCSLRDDACKPPLSLWWAFCTKIILCPWYKRRCQICYCHKIISKTLLEVTHKLVPEENNLSVR